MLLLRLVGDRIAFYLRESKKWISKLMKPNSFLQIPFVEIYGK
jgi:hypothetical protein